MNGRWPCFTSTSSSRSERAGVAAVLACLAAASGAGEARGEEQRGVETSSAALELVRFVRPKAPPAPPKAEASRVQPNQVIGADDRLRLEQLRERSAEREALRTVAPAAAFARFGACTATHIGQGFFLTAGHCIDQQRGFVGFRTQACGSPLELHDRTAACRVVAYRFDAKNDHALLALEDAALAASLPKVPVDYGFEWPRERTREVQLFGYSGGVLRVNLACRASWDARSGRVLHDCDTEGGDSGSALIDRATRQIIAVHGGAISGQARNYGYAIAQLPWAESICVSVGSSERLALAPGAAPATFRVSTKGLGAEMDRLIVDLRGKATKSLLSISVFGPDARAKVESSWIRWDGSGGFIWRDLYSLSARREGPWSVEVSLAAGRAPKGYVDGRIWVCP